MEAFIGTILSVAFNYPPYGWAPCNGQMMSVSQNSALFAIVGTTYGGDGVSTFGIPDLRGRVAVGAQAQGPGLANINVGDKQGVNSVTAAINGTTQVTIGINNLPVHSHSINASTISIAIPVNNASGTGNTDTPGPTTILTKGVTQNGPSSLPAKVYTTTVPANSTLLPFDANVPASTSGNAGSGQALTIPFAGQATINVMQPYLGINYIICLNGLFPSRN